MELIANSVAQHKLNELRMQAEHQRLVNRYSAGSIAGLVNAFSSIEALFRGAAPKRKVAVAPSRS